MINVRVLLKTPRIYNRNYTDQREIIVDAIYPAPAPLCHIRGARNTHLPDLEILRRKYKLIWLLIIVNNSTKQDTCIIII